MPNLSTLNILGMLLELEQHKEEWKGSVYWKDTSTLGVDSTLSRGEGRILYLGARAGMDFMIDKILRLFSLATRRRADSLNS